MTKNEILMHMREKGKTDALDLRNRAPKMDGTAIIAEEDKVPKYDAQKDYRGWDVGSPGGEEVDGERQVFTLLQPHNAAQYPGSKPSTTRALWSLTHTKDPAKAKPWVASLGISGMYMVDEVCTRAGHVWRSTQNNNSHEPGVIGTESFWDDLGEIA